VITDRLTLVDAYRMVHEDQVKDKSYRAFPLGQEAGHYLRMKRKRLTKSSYRDYESSLDKLARFFPHLELADFEPPVGTERLEEFLDVQWGAREPRTYNKNLSIMCDFFKWQVLRGRLHGDPALAIERAKKRGVYRTAFNPDQIRAIIVAQEWVRDRLAVRLLLDYGLRKGTLQAVQFKHFDHYRRQLTIFSKGENVRDLRIPHKAFWHDLERYKFEIEAQEHHYLLARQRTHPVRFDGKGGKALEFRVRRWPEDPMGDHCLHDWWYDRLAAAGIVEQGTTRGEKMHKARHTAGQRVLDATGNLKAAQKLLGHADIATTGNEYVDWDNDQLAGTMELVVEDYE
jgi:site-specific recombinase XerC